VRVLLVAASLLAATSSWAAVRLPALFTDNLVLQQGRRVTVWGWAGEGEQVTVRLRGQEAKAVARDGKWKVALGPFRAGSGDELVVSGQNTLRLTNVAVGEVWVCSGQSNMEWPMTRTSDPAPVIAAAANPNLRLFTVPKLKAEQPVDDVKAAWAVCSPATVPNFSAVAYYFGRALEQARHVPVGLIHTSWGGSPAEVWMRQDVLAADADYRETILDRYTAQSRAHKDELAKWERETTVLAAEGKKPSREQPRPPFWKPAELYNGMIAPLLPYAIRGAIWYQGESNADRALQYRRLFVDMIQNWRQDWNQGDFPFLAVQLAPWDRNKKRGFDVITAEPGESSWAELREAQVLATQALPKVGVAVITDAGDKDDIHPINKRPAGERLALAARAIAYGERIAHTGPRYRSMRVRGREAVLRFDGQRGGLVAGAIEPGAASSAMLQAKPASPASGGSQPLWGFSICGADRRFVWAEARLEGDRVVVQSPLVERPVAVRYGWSDHPVCNLYDRAGLPASPFRTDDFPMTTAKK
jgi:sialate O-acetylesterase